MHLAAPLIPLHELAPGQTAYIGRIVGQVEHVHRLEELGLQQGMRVEMFRAGNPCILRLAGNKVCLRADNRVNVLVTRSDPLSQPC